MLKTRNMKKIITILLIVAIVYANMNTALLGVISYAIDNTEIKQTDENVESKKTLEIEISEISKNEMLDRETEYSETLNLKLDYEKELNQVLVSDVNTIVDDGSETKELQEEIATFYKQTIINKTELLKEIGEGKLEISYEIKENEQEATPNEEPQTETELAEESEENTQEEQQENLQEIEKVAGQVIAENGLVTLNAETEADSDGNITIIYPENTVTINIKIQTQLNTMNLRIVNNKIIEKLENADNINQIKITKQLEIQAKEELVRIVEEKIQPITYSKSFVELGIDKMQIATGVENKIDFTITMNTEKTIYDLYKNPTFTIELPSIITETNLETLTIINNPYFTIQTVEKITLENGNNAILIKLEGEQTEHTKSIEENMQLVLRAAIKTEELVATTESKIKLHYQNENAKTYNGVEAQTQGEDEENITFVSNKEIMVQTKAILGETIYTSPKDNYNTVTVAPNTFNVARIIGTVLNNMGQTIQTAKILGKAPSIGEISGVENVYYTKNGNATIDITDINNGWQKEYTQEAKQYLIIVENFNQAQKIDFGYYMYMPTNIENDITHIAQFEVYNDNNELVNTSKITINQEAEKLNIYEDEKIKAQIELDNSEKLEIGDYIEGTLVIENISGREVNDVAVALLIPETLSKLSATRGEINESEFFDISYNEENLEPITLAKDAVVTINLLFEINEVNETREKITANINYEGRTATISDKVNLARPSQILTTATSNKIGETLQARDMIEYTFTLQNIGESYAEVDLEIPELDNMNIIRIQTTNLTTAKTRSITATRITTGISNIDIAPGETVEVKMKGIAKELTEPSIATMYVDVIGDKIYNVSTDKIANKIEQVEEEKEPEVMQNSIQGTAWIDKNENGQKDENETLLKGVQAVLINTKTAKQVDKVITDNNGEYEFNNVGEGTYVVEFKYNTNTFGITEYKNKSVVDELNSSVINTTQNNKTTAKTEVIKVEEGKNNEKINAGFVINKNFDMSINKGINKVTVNNEKGTKTYNFNSQNLAKVEIEGKYLKGSIIIVEYEIGITNVGELEGYAKLISDKIPEGMIFSSELNTDWYEGQDGKIYSEAFANKKIMPGETATIKLVLTKEMKDDKVVTPINVVNIDETFNDYLIADKNENNNSAEATIIISLTTGKINTYLWVGIVVIAIIGLGTLGIVQLNRKNMRNNK